MDSFDETLAAARSGDETAFMLLFRAQQPVLLRALTVLAGPVAAEDIAAETWLSALRRFDRFTGDERGFRAWLLTIARARWVDSVRAEVRRPETPQDVLPEQAGHDDVHATVERRITTAQALTLIASLPPETAEVLTLRIVAELDVAEVARIVGKTPNHVRVLTHRGLRRLARQLSEAEERL